jgi:hypothetical protein
MDSRFLVMSLAALTSATISIQALTAYIFLRSRIGVIGAPPKGQALTLRVIVAGVVTALVGYGMITFLGGTGESSLGLGTIAGAVAVIAAAGLVMLATYLAVLKLLKVPEIDIAFSGIAGILRR